MVAGQPTPDRTLRPTRDISEERIALLRKELAEVYYAQALLAMIQGDYALAIQRLEKAVAQDPEHVQYREVLDEARAKVAEMFR